MNIIFVTTHLTVFVGGSKFLMEYANKFSEHGHKVTIVAQKIDLNNYKFHRNISLIEVGGPLPSNPLHWIMFNAIKNKYMRTLKILRGDIMVSIGFPANLFCALSSRYNGITHMFYCLEPFRYFYDKKFCSEAPLILKNIYRILRILFKRYDMHGTRAADRIICISNFIKNRVQKIYNKNSQVHYIGIETANCSSQINHFNPSQQLPFNNKNAPIIFTLGFSHHLKGGRELILIFKEIIKKIPNAVLLIGGWMTKRNNKIMKCLIDKFSIPQENIVFCGFIKQHFINYFYKNVSLVIYTAIDESYGYIPLESMKNGTPVIAFEGGPSETIVDGQTGYIIKNGGLDEFAQKTITLLQDEALRRNFSDNAKQHIKINFDLEKSFLKLEKIIQEIISNKPTEVLL